VEAPSTPEGTVTFTDGGIPLATIPLGGSGQATLAISSLALGSHAITATYSGDADVLGVRSSATDLSVDPDGTRVVLVPQAIFKKRKVVSVGLKAEIEPISPGGGLPAGQVTFELTKKARKKLKVKTLGTISVDGGTATLTLKPKQVLSKAVTIVYSGNDDFLASQLIPPKLTKKQLKSLAQPLS
jgi:large repetitive protein